MSCYLYTLDSMALVKNYKEKNHIDKMSNSSPQVFLDFHLEGGKMYIIIYRKHIHLFSSKFFG